ncbi:DoxX family protein [Flavobacterium chuncheonense]|uniref:DoxX family protein n=1 Tax=Flavobacterium chuncheonense TaxID=2026653 RepID=A0ABW5YIA4_9FLAO
MSRAKIKYWLLRIVPAIIMLQTLHFKFTAAPESISIFEPIKLEPHGRIATGIFELIAAILLLIPTISIYGAVLGLLIMIGAILSHLFILEIEILNDNGSLFMLACLTFICCSAILFAERNKISIFKK